MAKPKITAEELAEYVELDQARLELDRKSRDLARKQATLAAHFQHCLEADGKQSVSRGGYTVSLVEKRGSISWKDEVVRLIGPLEVAKIEQAAPSKSKVVVTPPEAQFGKKAA